MPAGYLHGKNSDVASRSTVISLRQLLGPLFCFTCDWMVNAHRPAVVKEEWKWNEVIASVLYYQMSCGLRKAFTELNSLKSVIIQNSARMAKDLERGGEASEREAINTEEFQREFSADLRKANVSRKAMRSIRRNLRKSSTSSFPQKRSLRMHTFERK